MRQLYSLGKRGNLYTWIKGYLTNKSQFVGYNNSKSETKCITHGVPQGSILGPLFFIVFMNDFSTASKVLNLLLSTLCADDTTVIIEGRNYNNLILTLNTISIRNNVIAEVKSTIFLCIINDDKLK